MKPPNLGIYVALLLLVPAGWGCDRNPRPDPAREAARREAFVATCVAEELVLRARENVRDLEGLAGPDSSGPLGRTGRAAAAFAGAYRDYAEARFAAAVYADSAANAGSAADSARFAARGQGYALSPPEPGTMEANVDRAYARNAAELRANPNHPCNRPEAP